MLPEIKDKPKSKLKKILSIESNVDALRKILEKIKCKKRGEEDRHKNKSM
jgi:hypothetical protein